MMLRPKTAWILSAEYGNSSFDIRHRFTFGPSYLIPGKTGFYQMLQGWQLTSTVSVFSGRPMNPTDSSDDLSGQVKRRIAGRLPETPVALAAVLAAPRPFHASTIRELLHPLGKAPVRLGFRRPALTQP